MPRPRPNREGNFENTPRRWKVGTGCENAIYTDTGKLMGFMMTPEIAAHVVALHNRAVSADG